MSKLAIAISGQVLYATGDLRLWIDLELERRGS